MMKGQSMLIGVLSDGFHEYLMTEDIDSWLTFTENIEKIKSAFLKIGHPQK